jgi:hypothetical protein
MLDLCGECRAAFLKAGLSLARPGVVRDVRNCACGGRLVWRTYGGARMLVCKACGRANRG